MSRRIKRTVLRLAIGGACLIGAAVAPAHLWPLYFLPYLIIGGDVLYKAAANLLRGALLDENFLMAIATIGAFVLGEYNEAVFVMLFYQVGELFQTIAVNRSRRSIAELINIRPDRANVERGGETVAVDPEEVQVGEVIAVAPGERIPLDGELLSGSTDLDTSSLTGEAEPVAAHPGDAVYAGAVNLTGAVRICVNKPYGESTAARIIELVENAGDKKAKTENFITRFARIYTPAVVGAAVLLAVLPPLLLGLPWADWFERGLLFLVVSCPCALVISVPMGFFGGIGGAAKQGILVKGSNYLEALASADTVALDKTGTLTKGKFRLCGVYPAGEMTEADLLDMAAHVELYSAHPTAAAVREAVPVLSPARVQDVRELPGRGVQAMVGGRAVMAGNAVLMKEQGIAYEGISDAAVDIYVAVDGVFAGRIAVADTLKANAAEAIARLKAAGVRRTVMLTGDRQAAAAAVAAELGLDEVRAQLLPADKVTELEALLHEAKGTLVYAGDGINDAPVLARADVGVAMGAIGSDAAIEAADLVLMDDDPLKLARAIAIARKTMAIVRENIVFAIGVKLLVLLLSALGMANMWLAVFADVGVAVLAILNALRALKS